MAGTFNSLANAQTLAEVLSSAPNAKGQFWSRKLELGSRNNDNFAMFEGAAGSNSPFWVKRDLSKGAGDKVTFTVMSDVAGPGVRGEQELTGNTSKPRFSTYSCVVDFFRDAFELTKKEEKFLAAGGSIEQAATDALEKKLGRTKQYDMMMVLILQASGNVYRPGGASSRDTIAVGNTLSLNDSVTAKTAAQRLGARQVDVSKNKHGSPVKSYIMFASDIAMKDMSQSTAWQTAVRDGGDRGDSNPLFTGRLVDWNGIGFFEHITVDPDWDDVLSDPLCPKMTLGQAFSTATSGPALIQNASNLRNLYTQWMGGYDYQWYEGQTAAPDSSKYYAWIVAPSGSIGFVRWTGTGNNGNRIALDGILAASAGSGGLGTDPLGSMTLAAISAASKTAITTFPVDSWIIPANARGVPIGYSFLLGAGAAVRAYGSTALNHIEQKRDYGFVKGFGYETIFGQAPCQRTDGKTHNYVLIEHAIDHPGLEIVTI